MAKQEERKGGESEAELFCSSGLLVATHAGMFFVFLSDYFLYFLRNYFVFLPELVWISVAKQRW